MDALPNTYFGGCRHSFCCSHGVLAEVSHADARAFPEHLHELPYVSLLLAGTYQEDLEGRQLVHRPWEAVFHPVGTVHADRVGGGGANLVCIEFPGDILDVPLSASKSKYQLLEADLSVLMIRLYRHLSTGTASPLVVESSIYELVATLEYASKAGAGRGDSWMHRCLEYVRCHYQDPLTIFEIARQVGVHPVHLSRVFRRTFNETLGDHINKVRISAACRQIMEGDERLTDVATASGFYDQSHFVRVFKTMLGCAPSDFRNLQQRGAARHAGREH